MHSSHYLSRSPEVRIGCSPSCIGLRPVATKLCECFCRNFSIFVVHVVVCLQASPLSLSQHLYSPDIEIIRQLMLRMVPGVPDIQFPIVDVREVAEAEVLALTAENAVDKRIILCTGHMHCIFPNFLQASQSRPAIDKMRHTLSHSHIHTHKHAHAREERLKMNT